MPVVVVEKARRKPDWVDVVAKRPVLRNTYRIAEKNEDRFSRAFVRLSRNLIDADSKERLLDGMQAMERGRMTLDEVVDQVDWYNEADPDKKWALYSANLERVYSDIVGESGAAEMKRLKLPIKFEVQKQIRGEPGSLKVPINPFSIRWVRDKVGQDISNISDDQRKLIRQIIADGFERGERPKAILKKIEELVGLTPREMVWVENRRAAMIDAGVPIATVEPTVARYSTQLLGKRSRRIARTETLDAASQGLMDSWQLAKEEGHVKPTTMKEWVELTSSPRTCPICQDLGGQRRPIDEPFESEFLNEPIMRPTAHPH